MKSLKSLDKLIRWILGAISASALISLFAVTTAHARSSYSYDAIRPLETLDNMEVSGTVTAKTDISLTVDTQLITVSESTSFTRNGQVIKLDDIQVGDRVKATTSQGMEGDILAIRVEVVTTD